MTYDDRHHQHFEEHGYVRLGQLTTVAELSALRDRIDALMLGRIATEGITFQLDGEGGEISGRIREGGASFARVELIVNMEKHL